MRVYAQGIRAGFGLAYYPGTSDLLVSMNQRDDLGARTPGDWLALVRQPVAVLGTAALVPEWTHGKVVRVALTKTADAYNGVARTFITGLHNPLPIVTTPAGAVLVGDWTTGRIYRVAP